MPRRLPKLIPEPISAFTYPCQLSLLVGDAGVIAVGGEQRQLGTGRGFHPADDEAHRCGVGLTLEGSVFSLEVGPESLVWEVGLGQ